VAVPPVVAVERLDIEAWVNSLQQKK